MNLKNKLKFTTSLEELKGKKLFISDNGVKNRKQKIFNFIKESIKKTCIF